MKWYWWVLIALVILLGLGLLLFSKIVVAVFVKVGSSVFASIAKGFFDIFGG